MSIDRMHLETHSADSTARRKYDARGNEPDGKNNYSPPCTSRLTLKRQRTEAGLLADGG